MTPPPHEEIEPQTGVTNIGVFRARFVLLKTCDSGVPSPPPALSDPPATLSGIRTGAHRRGGLDLIALGAGGGTSARPTHNPVLTAGVSSSPRRRLRRGGSFANSPPASLGRTPPSLGSAGVAQVPWTSPRCGFVPLTPGSTAWAPPKLCRLVLRPAGTTPPFNGATAAAAAAASPPAVSSSFSLSRRPRG